MGRGQDHELVACVLYLPHQADREGVWTWTQILALLPATCVALGELLSLPVPQFPHPQLGDTTETHLKVLL